MIVCLGCEDRKIGCHGDCKRYLEEKSEHDKARHSKREQKIAEAITIPPSNVKKPRYKELMNKLARNYGA